MDSIFSSSDHSYLYQGPPLTDEMIQAAELRLGVSLPKAYLELLHVQNGGFVHKEVEFDGVDDTPLDGITGIGFERGIDSPDGGLNMSKEWEYPDGLLWFEGDGHTGYFFDYRSGGPHDEPPIIWLDTECEPYEEVQVATNFSEFIQHFI